MKLIEGNDYRIQYAPTLRGRHELIVTVNGQEVTGSHFPVFVSIHPLLLGKPRFIDRVKEPWDVAVSATGNIAVTDSSGSAVLFDKNGRKLRKLRAGVGKTHSIAVDNVDGSMYLRRK